jgi:hypothetical protein
MEKPEQYPVVNVQELKTSLQVLVARTAQSYQCMAQPITTNNFGTFLHDMMKNQIAIMGACAALLTNVINVKESLGET